MKKLKIPLNDMLARLDEQHRAEVAKKFEGHELVDPRSIITIFSLVYDLVKTYGDLYKSGKYKSGKYKIIQFRKHLSMVKAISIFILKLSYVLG